MAGGRAKAVWWVAVALGAAVVFILHFRPWEAGLLEDWLLVDQWRSDGPAEYANYLSSFVTRPITVLIVISSIALTGDFVGYWLGHGLMAAGQFLVLIWAFRPVVRSRWLLYGAALVFALHPLWAAGYVLRFTSATEATFFSCIALGLLVRYLRSGRRLALAGAFALQAVALLTYQAGAIVFILATAAVAAVIASSWRRRLLAVSTAVLCTAVVFGYNVLVAPLINPGSYVTRLLDRGGGFVDPAEGVRTVYRIVTSDDIALLVGIVAVLALAGLLRAARAIDTVAAFAMAALAVLSPFTALVFLAEGVLIGSPERVSLVVGQTLALALIVWAIGSRSEARGLQAVLIGAGVVGSLVMSVFAIRQWNEYEAVQQQVLAAIGPAVAEASDEETVVVVDHSGTLGSDYLFFPGYLRHASSYTHGDRTDATFCRADDAPPRPEGNWAPTCDELDLEGEWRPAGSAEIPGGRIEVFVVG